MAAGALKRSARVVYASAGLAAALAALLGVWFASGWADVRTQQREVRAEPERAAERKSAQLAHDLRGELQLLMTRETARPYYHYSNLFHDPRAGGKGVTPSPLSTGTEDPLVLGYFQIDPAGRVSTPTINDDVPELSESKNLAAHQAFRSEVTRTVAGELRSPKAGPLVAQAPKQPRNRQAPQQPQQQTQVLNLDPSSYEQNWSSNANEIYIQQNRIAPRQVKDPGVAAMFDSPIPVIHSAFEWRTFTFTGTPTLVGVRRVDTPHGTITQGFVVDRSTLTGKLAARAGESVAELRAIPEAEAAEPSETNAPEVAPGWALAVSANPRSLVESTADAARVARGFIVKFIVIGLVAALALGFVVLLVARAEQLARERSQFAAAAAHELRTPLAGLQLYGDMLADGLGDPGKMRDYARRMSEEASRLGRVVSNVLGFSQLERGNLSVEARSGDLAAALSELAERAQPALDRAGAVLDLDVTPELRARFDRDALARIVGNLLDNAEKYGREAEDRTISLAARAASDRVEITVTDRGPGVAQPARLFRAFSRGVTADGPAGLGLGLALSQSLARAMGGDLEHRPSATGATFVLRLQPP